MAAAAAIPVTAILRRVALALGSQAHTQSQMNLSTATQKHLNPVRRRPGGFTPTGTDFTKLRPPSPLTNVGPRNRPLFGTDPISGTEEPAPPVLPSRAPPPCPAPGCCRPRPRPRPGCGGRGTEGYAGPGKGVVLPRLGSLPHPSPRALIGPRCARQSTCSLLIRARPVPPPLRGIFQIPLGTALFWVLKNVFLKNRI